MRRQKNDTVTTRLRQIAKIKRFPIDAEFELTYRCNFNCIHCYITERQKSTLMQDELKTKEVFLILRELHSLGCLYIGFTGGEPFMRKDIMDILWYAKKRGFVVDVLTNGALITESIANELQRLRPNLIDIGINAMNKDTFEYITQRPASHKMVFNAIDLLRKRNIPIGLKTCGMIDNKGEIINIFKFAKTIKALYRFTGEIMPKRDGSKEPYRYMLPLQEMFYFNRQCYLKVFSDFDDKNYLSKPIILRKIRSSKRIFNCQAGYTQLAINPFGKLKICLDIDYPLYDILKSSLLEGWQKIKDFIDNLKPDKDFRCKSCELLKFCFSCPARAYLERKSFSACTPFERRIAKLNKKML